MEMERCEIDWCTSCSESLEHQTRPCSQGDVVHEVHQGTCGISKEREGGASDDSYIS